MPARAPGMSPSIWTGLPEMIAAGILAKTFANVEANKPANGLTAAMVDSSRPGRLSGPFPRTPTNRLLFKPFVRPG